MLGAAAYQIMRRKRIRIGLFVVIGMVTSLGMGFLKHYRGDFHIGSDFENVRAFLNVPLIEQFKELSFATVSDESGPRSTDMTTEIRLYIEYVNIIPDVVDFDYGEFYKQLVVQWIPKVVWPSRPDYRAAKRDEILAVLGTSHVSGPTPTIIGFYWMHYGFVAVCIGCWLTGLFYAYFDAHGRFMPYQNVVATAFFLSTVGSGAAAAFGLGPIAAIQDWGPFVIAPLFGMVWFATRPRSAVRPLPSLEYPVSPSRLSTSQG